MPLIGLGFLVEEMYGRKIRHAALMQISHIGEMFRLRPGQIFVKSLPRKTSKHNASATVPQTDTGDQVE
jgi:hypothetical protein